MAKTAFITMDAESFFDTECVKGKTDVISEYTCKEQVGEFLKILDERGIKGTFFAVGEFFGDCKEYLLSAVKNGHEIGVHAYSHLSPAKRTEEDFAKDLIKAKTLLEDELRVKIYGYRAPCFGISEKVAETVKKAGFLYDSSALNTAMGKRYPLKNYEKISDAVYREKDGDFWEFKPVTAKFLGYDFPVCGGGYLRIAPWGLYKKLFDKKIKSGGDFLLYLHPFELYGGDFPKIKGVKAAERYYLNAGRKDYKDKIIKILDALIAAGYEFETPCGYIKKHGGIVNV